MAKAVSCDVEVWVKIESERDDCADIAHPECDEQIENLARTYLREQGMDVSGWTAEVVVFQHNEVEVHFER